VLLALVYTVYLLKRKKFDYKKAFLLGAAFGLAYNARPPELILFPLIMAVIIFVFMKKKFHPRKISFIITSFFIGFAVLISVQYVQNYVIYGEKRFAPSAAAKSFEIGSELGKFTDENKMLGDMGFNPFKDPGGSVSIFTQNPATVSALLAKGFSKRFIILWFIPNFGVFDPVYLVNPSEQYSGYFFRFPIYMQCYAFLLVLVGIFAAFGKKENLAGVIVLVSFLAYMSFRVAVFFVLNSRYRGVLLPVATIFFAYGLDVLYRKLKDAYGGRVLEYAKKQK